MTTQEIYEKEQWLIRNGWVKLTDVNGWMHKRVLNLREHFLPFETACLIQKYRDENKTKETLKDILALFIYLPIFIIGFILIILLLPLKLIDWAHNRMMKYMG